MEPLNNETSNRKVSNDELLVGACELGLLETAWEYFIQKPKYDYLFVIDAPCISSVHALPPHNIAHFGVTGFLDSPAAPANLKKMTPPQRQQHFKDQSNQYPLTLGLTEILARYLFDRRWSNNRPKLMMPSQSNRVGGIMDSVALASSREITQSLAHTSLDNPLQDLQKKYFAARDKDANAFIDDITGQLEKLLPAIYGAYTTTRQLLRYAEVLPFPDRPDAEQATVFVNSYGPIADLLTKIDGERDTPTPPSEEAISVPPSFNKIFSAWEKSIPTSGISAETTDDGSNDEDETTERENARTLAEIEYINRALQQQGKRTRLVFITTTDRLYRAALYRHEKMRIGEHTPQVKYGTQGRYNKCQYLRHLLTGQDVELEMTPLLDPRALMTSPDFVNYANREEEINVEEKAREISAWLPAFFGNDLDVATGELDVVRLFNTYSHYQSAHSRGTSQHIKVESFSEKQYAGLWESWGKYIRIVSAAEGAERIMRREAFHDIRAQFVVGTSLRDLMGKRLDKAMSDWLAIVGGNALQAVVRPRPVTGKRSRAKTTSPKFRVVPPLILPAFSSNQVSIYELLQHLQTQGPTFNEGQFNWLTKPTPLDFQIESSDPKALHKMRYIQMLGQAEFFASMGNWDAAYRLSTQAYALAEQFLLEDKDRDKSTYVSGREAAYYASVTARRLRTSWISADRSIVDGHKWVAKYRKAVEDEPYISRCPFRHDLHIARSELEGLAWDAFSLLYYQYRCEKQELPIQVRTKLLSVIKSEHDRLYARLLSDDLDPDIMDTTRYTDHARREYKLTHTYLLRQLATIAIQTELLVVRQDVDIDYVKRFLDLLLNTACTNSPEDRAGCLPLSQLEKLVIRAACKVSGSECPIEVASEQYESVGFDLWRCGVLKKLVGESG